ncbi:MAG: ComEC/Rec2 family competence protein [Fluviicola sp.]
MNDKQLIHTLLIPTIGLVFGIGCTYQLFNLGFTDHFNLVLLSLILAVALYFIQLKNKLFFRNAFVGFLFFTLGTFVFTLNDYRIYSSDIDSNETIYLAKVEAVKPKSEKGQLIQVSIQAKKLSNDWRELKNVRANLFIYQAEKNFEPDQTLLIKCRLENLKESVNPGAFDSKFYNTTQGVLYTGFVPSGCLEELKHEKSSTYYFWKSREFFKSKIQSVLPKAEEGVAVALLLGDKSLLEDSVISAFTNTGTMHVLAVSGMHVGIILLILLFILERFSKYINRKQALIIALVLIWMYGFLAGGSAAVMRSIVMFTIISSAQLLNRPSSNLNNLFLSAILLLLWNPWYLFDLGFQLSYAAMIGLFLFTEPLEKSLPIKNKALKWLWSGTCAGVAATICTTPFILYWFHQFPNYFILSNFGILILGFPLLLFGFILLISPFIPFLFKITAFILGIVIYVLIVWVEQIDKIPGAISNGFQLTWIELSLGILCIVLWLIYIRKKVYLIPTGILTLTFIALLSINRFESEFSNKCIVLEHESLQLIVTSKNKAYSFYEVEENKPVQKYDTLFRSNFERFSGLITELIQLKSNNSIKIKNRKISIDKKNGGWFIQLNNKNIFYRTNLYAETPKNTDTIINKKQIQEQMGLPSNYFSFSY